MSYCELEHISELTLHTIESYNKTLVYSLLKQSTKPCDITTRSINQIIL